MSVDPIAVEFVGPFSWPGDGEIPSILEADVGDRSGVYLWTVPCGQQELIYYVGETGRGFSVRMAEHFEKHTSGAYHLYEPREFSCGRKVALWHGMYGPDKEPSLLAFIRRLRELAPVIADLAEMYRFYVAPLECEKRMRERIEAALARYLYERPGLAGEFQDKGILYRGRKSSEEPAQVLIRCNAHLIDLPKSLWV